MSELEGLEVLRRQPAKPVLFRASHDHSGEQLLARCERRARPPPGRHSLPAWHAPAERAPLTSRGRRGNACYSAGDYWGAVRAYSEALQHASGDALACTALVLNRSAAHAGLRQWHESLADADTVPHGARHPATGSVPISVPADQRAC
jgi:hypothetical protein